MAEQITQVAGTIPEAAHYSKTRRDERFVLVDQKNIEINSGDEYIAIDSMEAGFLQSVKVVVDNPYVQVLLQLDEYRNKDPDGQCPAEIIYNGNSDSANRSFKVLDGQGSGKGYVMEYKPNQPEEYKGRIRLVIRNSIKPSRTVYGLGLNYSSAGSLPTPAVPAHMAGGTFSHPAFEALSLGQLAQAMTKPVGVSGYASTNVYNESAIMNSDIELGSDHPYEGIAGKPTFTRDKSALAFMEVVEIAANDVNANSCGQSLAHYACKIVDEPESFPGSTGTPSQMTVEFAPEMQILPSLPSHISLIYGFGAVPWYGLSTIRKSDLQAEGPFGDTWPGTSTYTPFTGSTGTVAGHTDSDAAIEALMVTNALDGSVLPAATSIIGQRMFIRRGGTVYFPGVVKTVTKRMAPWGVIAGTAVAAGGEIDGGNNLVNGCGRFLDNNHATNKFTTEDTYFAVGAHNQTTGNDIIVIPFFNAHKNTALEGVKIAEGTANVVTLTDTTTNLLASFHDGSGGGNYDVFHTPHTPWIYTFTFEPGVTSSPIDFHVTYDNENDNQSISGHTFSCEGRVSLASTGIYAGTTTLGTGDDNAVGLFPASESNCWGTVTSQADTNPKALIKSIEIKRNKTVSFEG